MIIPSPVFAIAAVGVPLIQQTAAGFAPLSSRASTTSQEVRRTPRSRILLLSSTTTPVVAPPSSSSSKQGDDDLSASSDDPDVNPKHEEEEESFDWFKQWYPLAPVEMLDPEVPHKFQLLGEDIVVWNDGCSGNAEYGRKKKKKKKGKNNRRNAGGEWRAFVDECPHRKVPLSEGRIENDGTLLCSYHGWRFQGETGKCVSVPQIITDSPTEHERIINNPKTSCQAHPTQVVDGVLYVWASRGENAALQASLTPITLDYKFPEDMDNFRIQKGAWDFRELPYGVDYFLENVVDPCHVPVSHHNIVGNRYDDLTMHVGNLKPMRQSGFAIEMDTPATTLNSTTTFIAPAAVHIENPLPEVGALQVIELKVSPSRPGFCNFVGRVFFIFDKKKADGTKLLPASRFTFPMPNWVSHLISPAFVNQDALFLHHQERKLHETGQYSSVGSYFDNSNTIDDDNESSISTSYVKSIYPVRTDKGVLNFRNWLVRFTPGQSGKIPYKLHNPTMPPTDNNVVFDVWNSHTKRCSCCQGAVRGLKRARFLTIAMALCCAVLRPFGKVPSLVATLSSAGIGYLLHKLIGLFYRHEFSHAQND